MESMKALIERCEDLWCQFAHDRAMWPVSGAYRCGECLRVRSVPWANAPRAVKTASGIKHSSPFQPALGFRAH
jgi:hypothetical protein